MGMLANTVPTTPYTVNLTIIRSEESTACSVLTPPACILMIPGSNTAGIRDLNLCFDG